MPEAPTQFFAALSQVVSANAVVDRIMDELPFNLIVDRAEGGCIYANKTQLRSFNMSWEEFRGYGWARLVHPGDASLFQKVANEFLGGTRERFELKYRVCVPPDGEVRWVHAYVLAIRDASSKYLGNVGVSFDVTELQTSRQQQAHAQKMEAMGRLSGRVAHDLNNLLSVLLACMYIMDRAPDDGRAQLPTMQDAVERARQLTSQLLTLARSGSEQRVCCLDEELRGLTALIHRTIGETASFEATLDAGLATVPLNGGQVGQIALNLASNARDAIVGKGRITCRTEARGERVRWVFEDDGAGMPPEVAARALEPFFSTKAPGEGTGLGLSTVADLVHEAEGEIAIDSAPGRGTRIVIELPLVQRPAVRVLDGGALPARGAGTLIVLEDHDALRQSLALALSAHGYRVLSTGTVREALYMAANEPELVALVTDLHLPDGLGTDCVEEMRKLRPDLPVVYTSGMPEELPRNLGAHATFVVKPVAPEELLRALAAVL